MANRCWVCAKDAVVCLVFHSEGRFRDEKRERSYSQYLLKSFGQELGLIPRVNLLSGSLLRAKGLALGN